MRNRTSREGAAGGRASPQFEDMLLLLVVGSDLTDGMPQGQRLFPVVGHPQRQVLGVLIEGQLAIPEHTVQVVPGPATEQTGRSPAVLTQRLCTQLPRLYLFHYTVLRLVDSNTPYYEKSPPCNFTT